MANYDTLNKEQKEAVLQTEGPLLLLAGAGSGKTRVLTHRIAYLIEDKKVKPWHILAITFTNKAAKEMAQRVAALVGEESKDIWVSTFHSSCARILRVHCDLIGFNRSFSIFDKEDSKRLIREIMKELAIDPKQLKDSAIMQEIGRAKNQFQWPSDYEKETDGSPRKQMVLRVYRRYQQELQRSNAMDFNDLLLMTVELFMKNPDILDKYQERFRYIMVDEYQDTNQVQFLLIEMLAKKYRNLCVVGDDDQSIYRFRGADIRNILEFEKVYREAKVIRLEQNYRSTKNILAAANSVIANNQGRKSKKLWTDNNEGDKATYEILSNEKEEARYLCMQITELMQEHGYGYNDFAILYRTNAQSRVIEEGFVLRNIPYRLVGGVAFYERKEIKDIIAYLRLVNNDTDSISCRRIINVPRRGIGNTSTDKLATYASEKEISFFQAVVEVEQVPDMSRSVKKIKAFQQLIDDLRQTLANSDNLEGFVGELLDKTGYIRELEAEDSPESLNRIENIRELVSKVKEYEKTNDSSLGGFLEEIALISAVDTVDEQEAQVVLMTLHSAKGLEFPVVFIAGMEEGLFPSYMSISSGDEEDIEEERRLAYVGITRAQQQLYLTGAKERTIYGKTQANRPSRFIEEIDERYLQTSSYDTATDAEKLSQSAQVKRHDYLKSKNDFFRKKPYSYGDNEESEGSTDHRRQAIHDLKKRLGGGDLPKPKEGQLAYDEGDMVKHGRYGLGKVLKIEAGGKDYQVTVDFPSHGVKKMLASFAKLRKK